MKQITDTIYGSIVIEEEFFQVIDSIWFQRLRKIEQSSIRSIFPCARHDRFVHSLGVFHIANLIVQQLNKEAKKQGYFGIKADEEASHISYEKVVKTYLYACLMHDIAHAPFSHTFEDYYGTVSELSNDLNKQLKENGLSTIALSYSDTNRIKPHEMTSAILLIHIAKEKHLSFDVELAVRMIIGKTFTENLTIKNQIENCFITLLNGGVADADRLDYACRDIWASGYSTSMIDVNRLISGMHIAKNNQDIYSICYEPKVINELNSLIAIKEFQTDSIFVHHTVIYEQYLIKRAAEIAFDSAKMTGQSKKTGLSVFVNYKNLIKPQSFTLLAPNKRDNPRRMKYRVSMISDGDLMFFMGQTLPNQAYQEWQNRSYSKIPLWKTRDEFYYKFPNTARSFEVKNNLLFKKVTDKLKELGFAEEEYLVHVAGIKTASKRFECCIFKDDQAIPFDEYYVCRKELPIDTIEKFYYVFVDKNQLNKLQKTKDEVAAEIGMLIEQSCPYNNEVE